MEYSELQKLNPDIIMVSSTGYGFDGPWANFGATGPATEGASGLAYSTGYKNGPPVMSEIPYTDYTGAEHTIFAIMAALIHRQTTGDGQFIDVSQTETSTATIPEFLMDYSANKRVSSRNGNEDPSISPQGCYPCMGDDRWIVISITNDEEWASLCIELNNSELTSDTRFSTNEGRMKHKQDIDDLIGRETLQWDNQELMKVLQTAGVPAGAVLDGQELLFNEHLKSRNFYEIVPHHPTTGMPPLPYAGRPWQFSTTPHVEPKAAPIMGEHNKSIFIDLLGYDESILEAVSNTHLRAHETLR